MTDLLTAARAAADALAMIPAKQTLAGILRAAIGEAEKCEPVAWMVIIEPGVFAGAFKHRTLAVDAAIDCGKPHDIVPLYLHPAPTVPEGWQLVPKEPTDEMEAAASEANSAWGVGKGNRYAWNYKAMLAAAHKYEGEGK